MLSYGAFLDLNCFLKFILMMIVPFLGLLAWAENKVPNSNDVNQHYSMGEELVQTSDEIDQFFEQDHEGNTVTRAYCACFFCGKLSHITTTCSRCKAALYCSKVCHVMHWRFWHKYECVEIEAAEEQEGSPSHGTHYLLMEPDNESSTYSSFTEVERKTDVGEIYYIEGGEKQNSVESSDGTATPRLGIVGGYDGCAVCGNPSTKKCSRCKAIKYCSQTCQYLDWRSGHKFQCVVEKANSTQAATVNQERPADGNEATNTGQKEIKEQLRSLKEELAKIKNENMSLQSERDNWEMQARHAEDRLYSFRKENEHQLFILKHENELISNAEKRACQMVHSLSQRLHRLQIEVETGLAERRKQEEYIRMLQNECAKARTELQEQKRCVQRLSMGLDEATQFPMRIAEETRQKLANALSAVAAAEVKLDHPERKITKPDNKVFQTISLSRNPTYTRQACAICLANEKDMAFGCGHMTCRDCGSNIRKCHICRKKITSRIRLFPG